MILGRVSALFGVRGWVRVYSYTEPREAILQYKGLLIGRNGDWKPAEVVEGQQHGKSVIALFKGFDDRDQAEVLIGAELGVHREDLPKAGDGQYYWSDLIGLKVVHRDGTELGIVDEMLETGANDVMVVKGEKERLIPFVRDEIVINVDLSDGRVDVDWEWD
jgi:16S rRNA processing protein RimM